MPIANCFVDGNAYALDPDVLMGAWSRYAGMETGEMTLNLITQVRQGGKRYAAMAWLYIPHEWSAAKSEALSEGLATALADRLQVDHAAVLVISAQLEAGSIVDDGVIVR